MFHVADHIHRDAREGRARRLDRARRKDLIRSAPALSPSTADKDFTEKLEEYTAIDSLHTYLICSQDAPRAWAWARQADGSWPKHRVEMAGRDGSMPLGGLHVGLAMAAVFRGIPDAPAVE